MRSASRRSPSRPRAPCCASGRRRSMPSSPERVIDLDADVGEGPGEGPPFALAPAATAACGGHAGNEDTMREAVRVALRHGAAVGAHPSFPDREGFGRVAMRLPPHVLAEAVRDQVGALLRVAEAAGAPLTHVKPHGALYNDAAQREDLARAIADGVSSVSRSLVLVGLAGSVALRVWAEMGFSVAAEGFVDRRYAPDGSLVPRTSPGALIEEPAAAAIQAVDLARRGNCDTLCVHGDTQGAVAIAQAVRRGLEDAGFVVTSFARPLHGR